MINILIKQIPRILICLVVICFCENHLWAGLNDGLVGYWNMDTTDINWDTNTILDRSGSGNAGTLVGFIQGTSSVPGKYGQALQFDGTNTTITIASSQTLNLSVSNAFTCSVWINVTAFTTSAGSFNGFICYDDSQAFAMHTAGSLLLLRPGGTVSQLLDYSTPVSVVGQWYHLVATYDGTTEKIYVDGALKGSLVSTGTVGFNSALSIGGGGGWGYFNGAIDEVRIYNWALSAQEVQELHQATSFDTTPLNPPAIPQGLVSPSHTFNSVSLSWTANHESNLASYRLYQDNVLVAIISGDSTSYQVTGLTPATAYSFQLSAVNVTNNESPRTTALYVTTNVPATPPAYPSKLQITGTLSPDATGIYDLQSTTYNGLPIWTRKGGGYSIYYLNPSIVRLSVVPGNWSAGMWKWDYVLSGAMSTWLVSNIPSTASVTYTGTAMMTELEEPGFPTPSQYLVKLPHPVFKAGNTLLPLTKWDVPYSYEMRVEMAHWGYALDFGDADANTTAKLSDPNSNESKLVALAHDNPSQYKLFANIPRLTTNEVPSMSTAYTVDSNGTPTTTWSPEAPDSVLSDMAAYISSNLQKVTSRTPVAVVLNGGERYLDVYGWGGTAWKADPGVVAAKGSLSWDEYASQRKAHQEMFFTSAVHALTTASYIWYYAGGDQYRSQTCSQWADWDWDYSYMHTVVDYPNTSLYWEEFNTGWVGHLLWTGCMGSSSDDMLSQALNAFGYAIKFGQPLSYNWVCAGYRVASRPNNGFGDIERYYGFLKSYYTAGMIGGIAGYFDYPTGGFNAPFDSNAPPHWLLQTEALAQVHAEFSYLEDILRNGDLLPGPDMNPKNPDQPAYEFRTGYADTRVLARKMKGQKRWLISVWAADGVTRSVSVAIPILGTCSLEARPSGSLYDGRIVNGNQLVTLLDDGLQAPTPLELPTATPDLDGPLTVLYGDVDGDGQITAYDAALTARHAVGYTDADFKNAAAADVDNISGVSAYDAALIAQRAVGLISKFPVKP